MLYKLNIDKSKLDGVDKSDKEENKTDTASDFSDTGSDFSDTGSDLGVD